MIRPMRQKLTTSAQRVWNSPSGNAVALIAIFALLPHGILVQAVGVYSSAAISWDGEPVDVDRTTQRIWDVADNPVFRDLGLSCPGNR